MNSKSGSSYSVVELAKHTDVSVDTIRYYQSKGILEKPERQGRNAVYSIAHVEQLASIKELADKGFTLAQIKTLQTTGGSADDPVLTTLIEEQAAHGVISRAQLLEQGGIEESMLSLAIDAGLLRSVDDGSNFAASSVDMVKAAGKLLDSGLPLDAFADLAVRHAQHVERLVDAAVALYRFHVEPTLDGDRDAVAANVRSLLPAVTQLVAEHFSRTLVDRAVSEASDLNPDDLRVAVEWT